MRWLRALGFAVLALIVATAIYFILPARKLPLKKPRFALFPKYRFNANDLENFSERVEASGFRPISETAYVRGSFFGDFLIRFAKLKIQVDRPSGTAIIKSGSAAILFDTGDLWQLAKSLESEDP